MDACLPNEVALPPPNDRLTPREGRTTVRTRMLLSAMPPRTRLTLVPIYLCIAHMTNMMKSSCFLSSSSGSVSTPDFFVYAMCVRYVCVHVYTCIHMYMKRHCVCIQMHCVCRHIHAYMSVFFLLSPHVCACMFTYMYICMQAC